MKLTKPIYTHNGVHYYSPFEPGPGPVVVKKVPKTDNCRETMYVGPSVDTRDRNWTEFADWLQEQMRQDQLRSKGKK